ncbi:MAG: 2,3-bisphosphoglycerate-independent phosphoglycerate mutase [Clostridiales bacterium]|jgi:2,3-bisphosphoglycerate-independent phosphoglycerate mutase|nr:2,3-bisphosphoglycerate-independent phosphoglycerate mutase [Clostridiales bacterium]
MDTRKTAVLLVIDGFGLTEMTESNAVKAAKTPNMDFLMENYPFALGYASGLNVGLPEGQMGNSEVGHLNIGAGRIVYQELTRVTKDIADGTFFQNKALLAAIENCKARGGSLHLMGLLSDGGVHSHNAHLYALLELAYRNGVSNTFIHAFLDGRDTPPSSGGAYIAELEEKAREIGVGRVATVSGRYYAMDRDNRWERVKKAYDALALGEGEVAESAAQCVNDSYAKKVTDEFVVPTVILEKGRPVATIKENDSVIFFNFRPDRAREITRAFVDADFSEFERDFFPLEYVCFTEYDATMPNCLVAFDKRKLENTMGEYLSKIGKTQLRLAETEKYAHVTFFFSGGVEKPFDGEDRILVPSPKVATYDLQPEMSAYAVTDRLIESILSNAYDLIVINYANCDMVGHTGVYDAAVKAVEAVDLCVGRVYDALIKSGAQMFVCADHGNSEKMTEYGTSEPFTAHTTNPVPFIIVNCAKAKAIAKEGKLCDVSPTLLDMMGVEQPKEMLGRSLIIA